MMCDETKSLDEDEVKTGRFPLYEVMTFAETMSFVNAHVIIHLRPISGFGGNLIWASEIDMLGHPRLMRHKN